ncbi:MAG: GNAT family N-acetyltransferase [Actinomycetota bacterium]
MFIGEREAWGRGLGRDAIVTVLAWGFDAFALHLVQLWGLSTNVRALAAYRRFGFAVDGTLRERSLKSDGERYDRTILSITRAECSTRGTAPEALRRNGVRMDDAARSSSCHSFSRARYQGICIVTSAFSELTPRRSADTFRSLRAAGAAESGNRSRDPWESRKANWAHLLVRLGRPTSCAGGEARAAPKPNERVYGQETETAVRGCSEHLSPRGQRWLEVSAFDEPAVPRVLSYPLPRRASPSLVRP